MLCGPKSSGKSTFTKLLSNRLLSAAAEKSGTVKPKKPNLSGVAILDLDPGQPEYSVPGQLSLVHVQDPNLGPPFTHPVPDGQGKIVRAHTIAAITPSIDPSHYMACTLDLFSHYRDLLSTHPKCPLIINTPGWVLGTGLEILVDLITRIRPTEVVYMSQKGPTEVVEALQEAAKSTPLITLPSQVSDYATKTAAHLRVMQLMSYFHLKGTEKGALTWSDLPLASVPPWEIKYSGDNTGMLGIMCYGEQPPPDLLFDSVNGSLVGIVVIDDTSAIPGWEVNNGTNKEESSENDQPYLMDVGDVEIRAIDEDPTIPGHLEQPVIVRTPDHSLPYFNPANAISLDPKHSHCIGLALVRGIDVPRQRLQVITPIPASLIEEVSEAGKSIVLVSGKLDTPGWAYTEELMQKQWLEKAAKNQSNVDDENVEETYDEGIGQQTSTEHFRRTPWIERQEGSQGRVAGSRVWRVRRDLGRWAE
jgi:polynucleotide 5'-hydroxyl-kinase GRC3/NOL9